MPCEVRVTPTGGHRVWGLLPDRGVAEDGSTPFDAADYLHLVDSAFEVGDLPEVEFAVA